MKFSIVFQEFNVEKVTKGRSFYEKGTVTYTNSKGDNKTQTIMSFANPAVFAILKAAAPGSRWTVETDRNEGGYEQWNKLTSEDENKPAYTPPSLSSTGTGNTSNTVMPTRTTYETPEERKQKQLYIIRQSSISNAIETLSVGAKSVDSDKVLELAQKYVDFVYDLPQLAAGKILPEDNPGAGV